MNLKRTAHMFHKNNETVFNPQLKFKLNSTLLYTNIYSLLLILELKI